MTGEPEHDPRTLVDLYRSGELDREPSDQWCPVGLLNYHTPVGELRKCILCDWTP